MRLTALLASVVVTVLAVVTPSALPVRQPRSEPFVPVGVSYTIGVLDRTWVATDFEAIRSLGFNTVRIVARWAEIESTPGAYRLDAIEQALDLAGEAGLRVLLELDTSVAPAWVLGRYRDGRFVGGMNGSSLKSSVSSPAGAARACTDHPAVRAAVTAFISEVSAHAARHPAWFAVDVGSPPPPGLCLCRYTQRRFKEWVLARHSKSIQPSDQDAFVREALADDLKMLADATKARGTPFVTSHASSSVLKDVDRRWAGQDDWQMSRVVDLYGTSTPLISETLAAPAPIGQALAMDGLRSAASPHGWLFTEDTSVRPASLPTGDALRMLAWTAVSRGARGLTFGDWRALLEPDGSMGDRVRALGTFAAILTRNQALFAPLRPRPAAIAIVHDPGATRQSYAAAEAAIYRALLARNIEIDFLQLDAIAAGGAAPYKALVMVAPGVSGESTTAALNAYRAAGGTIIAGVSSSDEVVQMAARAGVTPDVRIDSTSGLVEMRVLESPEVIMLIGLNHSQTAERVTMRFAPDTQEAIWQNLETGTGVNFVAGPDGPTYAHTFRAQESLVLMIRRSVR